MAAFLIAAVLSAPPPQYFARVDVIVINRVRSQTTSWDAWGRPLCKPTETWWISFWEIGWFEWSDRGWWSMTSVRSISKSSCGGWVVESNDDINIVADELILIDSPYDWEMRNRVNYRPIRKP